MTTAPAAVDVDEDGAVVLLVALFSITKTSPPLLLLILAVLTNCTYFKGCYSLVVLLTFSLGFACLLAALLLAAMIPDEFAPANREVEVLLFVLPPSFITPAFFLNSVCAPTFVEDDVIDVFGTEVLSDDGFVFALDKPTPWCGR